MLFKGCFICFCIDAPQRLKTVDIEQISKFALMYILFKGCFICFCIDEVLKLWILKNIK
jgi:hypothetical protein